MENEPSAESLRAADELMNQSMVDPSGWYHADESTLTSPESPRQARTAIVSLLTILSAATIFICTTEPQERCGSNQNDPISQPDSSIK